MDNEEDHDDHAMLTALSDYLGRLGVDPPDRKYFEDTSKAVGGAMSRRFQAFRTLSPIARNTSEGEPVDQALSEVQQSHASQRRSLTAEPQVCVDPANTLGKEAGLSPKESHYAQIGHGHLSDDRTHTAATFAVRQHEYPVLDNGTGLPESEDLRLNHVSDSTALGSPVPVEISRKRSALAKADLDASDVQETRDSGFFSDAPRVSMALKANVESSSSRHPEPSPFSPPRSATPPVIQKCYKLLPVPLHILVPRSNGRDAIEVIPSDAHDALVKQVKDFTTGNRGARYTSWLGKQAACMAVYCVDKKTTTDWGEGTARSRACKKCQSMRRPCVVQVEDREQSYSYWLVLPRPETPVYITAVSDLTDWFPSHEGKQQRKRRKKS